MTLFICLTTTRCVGTDVGNPQGEEIEIEVEFAAFEETAAGALTLDQGVEIDEAWIVIDRIRLRRADPCEDDGEFDLRSPIIANLLRPEETIGTRRFTRRSGDYCRFIVEFDDIDEEDLPAGAPAQLAEHSIFIAGRRDDGVAFELRADFGDRFRLDAEESPFRLERVEELLQVAFAANTWFDVDALNALESDGDMIRIDDDNNAAILEDFRDAIKNSARLFRDGNLDELLATGG